MASLVALPVIVAVLGSPDASNHFTNQAISREGVIEAANDTIGVLLGIALPRPLYLGFGIVLYLVLFSVRKASAQTRCVLWTLLAPFFGLIVADLVLGGIRSTVPRYSLSCVIAFALALAVIFGDMWQRRRSVAMIVSFGIIIAQLLVPCSIDRHLKGGRYEVLAWYTKTYGNTESLVLSTLPGNRSIEFAANSFSATAIIPVSGFLSSSVIVQARVAHEKGIPVLSVIPSDAIPPFLPGEDERWIEEFAGAQASIFRLIKK